MTFGALFVCLAATLLRPAAGGCEDFSLLRGLAGILVDTCPSKYGTCCGKSNVKCLSASYSAVCRCPDCPTTTAASTTAAAPGATSARPVLTSASPSPTAPGGSPLSTASTTTMVNTITAPQADCGALSTNCELCLTYECEYCVGSKACVRRGAGCAEAGDQPQAQCSAPVDGAPQQVMIGNVTVNVTVMGQFDQPIGQGLSFTWMFDPAVAISWIELADFDSDEQAILTITRTADGATEKITITEFRQDLIERTETGFNVYRLDAVGNSTFRINTLSIVPAVSVPKTEPPPPAPLSTTAAIEPGSLDGLAIGLIVGGILLCLLALAAVLFLVRRRRRDDQSFTGTPQVASANEPSRISVYGNFAHQASNGGVPAHYGAAPASVSNYGASSSGRAAEIVYEASAPDQNQYGEAQPLQVVYGNAPPLGGAYTDPRRSAPTNYEGIDSPLH